jgi:hypothetical protein
MGGSPVGLFSDVLPENEYLAEMGRAVYCVARGFTGGRRKPKLDSSPRKSFDLADQALDIASRLSPLRDGMPS